MYIWGIYTTETHRGLDVDEISPKVYKRFYATEELAKLDYNRRRFSDDGEFIHCAIEKLEVIDSEKYIAQKPKAITLSAIIDSDKPEECFVGESCEKPFDEAEEYKFYLDHQEINGFKFMVNFSIPYINDMESDKAVYERGKEFILPIFKEFFPKFKNLIDKLPPIKINPCVHAGTVEVIPPVRLPFDMLDNTQVSDAAVDTFLDVGERFMRCVTKELEDIINKYIYRASTDTTLLELKIDIGRYLSRFSWYQDDFDLTEGFHKFLRMDNYIFKDWRTTGI